MASVITSVVVSGFSKTRLVPSMPTLEVSYSTFTTIVITVPVTTPRTKMVKPSVLHFFGPSGAFIVRGWGSRRGRAQAAVGGLFEDREKKNSE